MVEKRRSVMGGVSGLQRKERSSGLTGKTVVSRCPQSTTRPVTVPVAIRASNGADAKLIEGTCRLRYEPKCELEPQ